MNQDIKLYQNIYESDNLEISWKLVKSNRGAPGVDYEKIEKVKENWKEIRTKLQEQLREKKYAPQPAKRVYIPKANGKRRALGIPTIRDRIVQQALKMVIEPLLEPTFEDFSYGFRPGKSAKQALEQVDRILEEGKRWVIQIDLKQFFDNIPHEVIMDRLREYIEDEEVLKLTQMFLENGVLIENKIRYATTGTPQGGVISPLLANLVLDVLDKYAASHGNDGMVRYADDFVILCKTHRRAVHVYKEVLQVLNKLGLEINEEKSKITHSSERFVFLGYEFGGGGYYKGPGGTVRGKNWKRPSTKAIKAFKDKIRLLTRRQQPRNIKMLINKCNPAIRGWGNYFKEGYCKTLYKELDEWFRMRLRSFIHKKKSYLDNYKYPNAYFKELGYVFLSDVIAPQ